MERVETTIGGLSYNIYEDGRIEKRRGRGFLKCFPDKDGYLKIAIGLTGRTFNAFLHRVVYEAFHGEIPEGMTVDHIDDDRLNNHHTNLQLLTPEENAIKGNAKHWKMVSPEGEVVEIYNMTEFCKEKGLHASHMMSVAASKPKYRAHKGWRRFHD